MLNSDFDQEYFDVLRSIETAIYTEYTQNDALTDHQVNKVIDALQRQFNAEIRQKRAPNLKFNASDRALYTRLHDVCKLHLGRDINIPIDSPLELDEMINCLKRISRSVGQMGGHGRQGYVDFLKVFFEAQNGA